MKIEIKNKEKFEKNLKITYWFVISFATILIILGGLFGIMHEHKYGNFTGADSLCGTFIFVGLALVGVCIAFDKIIYFYDKFKDNKSNNKLEK